MRQQKILVGVFRTCLLGGGQENLYLLSTAKWVT
jgi:hypothetical protein